MWSSHPAGRLLGIWASELHRLCHSEMWGSLQQGCEYVGRKQKCPTYPWWGRKINYGSHLLQGTVQLRRRLKVYVVSQSWVDTLSLIGGITEHVW